jgi:hypothetical protein
VTKLQAEWETKRAEGAAELKKRARQDLIDAWQAWLKEIGPGKGRGTNEVDRQSPQECGTELQLREDGHRNAMCVMTLTNWFACKRCKLIPGRKGREKNTEYEKIQIMRINMQNMRINMQNMKRNMQNMKRNMHNMKRKMQNM